MAVLQVSCFIENRPGALQKMLSCLKDGDINLRSLCMAETEKYGIARMIADDNEKTLRILKENGYTAGITEVLGVIMPDHPGALSEMLVHLSRAAVNVEYMYSMLISDDTNASIVLRVNDNALAQKVLSENGFAFITEE